jgi:hypothetical protein
LWRVCSGAGWICGDANGGRWLGMAGALEVEGRGRKWRRGTDVRRRRDCGSARVGGWAIIGAGEEGWL